MRLSYLFCFLILIIIALPLLSAAHYILGIVNNALDGTAANDHIVVLWNPAVGENDNLTDIIGPNGNSGVNNNYRIDCELLNAGCNIGDEIRVKVLNNGDNYIIDYVNLTVTGAENDTAPNLTLNSPPNSSLNAPINYANFSSTVQFNCSAGDLDGNLANATLYGNWSGGWHANETISVSGNFSTAVFTKDLIEGRYEWNCLVKDNLSLSDFYEQNFTLTVDKTPPVINSVFANASYVCGNASYIRVNCTITDSLTSVNSVVIQAISASGNINYSAGLLNGDTYYADVLINYTGIWAFNCIANDSAGNANNLTALFNAYTVEPDLFISFSQILFSDLTPLENEGLVINATVENRGCGNANNFLVGFYKGDPQISGTQINQNKTISVLGLSNITTNVSWNAEIGTTNIFVLADVSNIIAESDEINNKANKTINITSWQDFYGEINGTKLLSDSLFYNLSYWSNLSNLGGNVFISDTESNIDWLSLQAIGINKTNSTTDNDFEDIDSLLGMASFEDSVYKTFTNNGDPKATASMIVHQKEISNVPVINSTNNSNFITGILWDTSDDNDDGEFSQNDKEDLIFVAKINPDKTGAYGVYDYEIRIPVKLRQYYSSDPTNVYLYYDLV
jgi:hypothetical protein